MSQEKLITNSVTRGVAIHPKAELIQRTEQALLDIDAALTLPDLPDELRSTLSEKRQSFRGYLDKLNPTPIPPQELTANTTLPIAETSPLAQPYSANGHEESTPVIIPQRITTIKPESIETFSQARPQVTRTIPDVNIRPLQLLEPVIPVVLTTPQPFGQKPEETHPYQSPKFDDDTPEEVLVRGAIQGDEEAFSRLYGSYRDRIYRHILYRVSSAETAEDLTQQVFMQSWRAIGRYKITDSPFVAWLFTISHNQVVSYYRRSHSTVPLDEKMGGEGTTWEGFLNKDIHAGPEEEILLSEDGGRVRVAIQRLRPEHQQVISMRFLTHAPHRDIAEFLGKSEGAVRVIQHRALIELRKIMSEQDSTILRTKREVRQVVEPIFQEPSQQKEVAPQILEEVETYREIDSEQHNLGEEGGFLEITRERVRRIGVDVLGKLKKIGKF